MKLGTVTYLASPQTHAGTASAGPSVHAGAIGRTGISVDTAPLPEDTEITGPIVFVLHVSSTSEDMDIFAMIRNIMQFASAVLRSLSTWLCMV